MADPRAWFQDPGVTTPCPMLSASGLVPDIVASRQGDRMVLSSSNDFCIECGRQFAVSGDYAMFCLPLYCRQCYGAHCRDLGLTTCKGCHAPYEPFSVLPYCRECFNKEIAAAEVAAKAEPERTADRKAVDVAAKAEVERAAARDAAEAAAKAETERTAAREAARAGEEERLAAALAAKGEAKPSLPSELLVLPGSGHELQELPAEWRRECKAGLHKLVFPREQLPPMLVLPPAPPPATPQTALLQAAHSPSTPPGQMPSISNETLLVRPSAR